MPPKPKKPKAKKPKSKAVQSTTGTRAIAKTTKAPAQAQNVTIRIGEVKKAPARRRRPPAKPKGVPPPQPTDGWLPPQNLMRNGASFAGAETIRYVNVPTPAQSSLFAGPPVAPPTFTQATQAPEPPEQSGLIAEFAPEETDWTDMSSFIRPTISGSAMRKIEPIFNVTEFLKEGKKMEAKKMGRPEMYEPPDYVYEEEAKPMKRQELLVPKRVEPPTLVPETPSKRETLVPETPTEIPFSPLPIPEARNLTQAMMIDDIREVTKQIQGDKPTRQQQREFNEKVYGQFGKKKSDLTAYNRSQLQAIRETIYNLYGR